ncbi:MAG: hypothetical protein GPJ21_17025 [Microcystis aeruginosa W13-11]|nr:hypothetical protein [Microcystis aeruginosa W13-11]
MGNLTTGDRTSHPKQRSPFVTTKNDRHSPKIDSPKMIALSQAKVIAVLKFDQQDDGNRTFKSKNDHSFKP